MDNTWAIALIYASPLAIPAMVWFCICVELADFINHPERHPYLMLAYVTVTFSDEYSPVPCSEEKP